jgi:hypothetical protein
MNIAIFSVGTAIGISQLTQCDPRGGDARAGPADLRFSEISAAVTPKSAVGLIRAGPRNRNAQ